MLSSHVSSNAGLLEEERLASAHQAEAFTRQIQNLQGIKTNICSWKMPEKRRLQWKKI